MSPGLSSFNFNLNDGGGNGSASQRPEGIKKYKMKRKRSDDMSVVLDIIRDTNKKLQQFFENSCANRERDMEVQMKKIEAQNKAIEARHRMAEECQRYTEAIRWEGDDKILMINTDSISNPARRLYFEQEQARILSKRQSQINQYPK